jgi:cytochrome P450
MTTAEFTPAAGEPLPLPRPSRRRQLHYVKRLFAEPHAVLEGLRDECGPMVGLGAGPVRLAVIGDAEAVRDIFAEPVDSFRWNHKFNVLGFVVGKESMIVSDGDDHRRRRKSVQAGFSRRRLNGWIPMIVEQTDDAIDKLLDTESAAGADGPVDLYPFGRSLVLSIVVRALCGPRLAERSDEIGALFQRPQDYLESPAIKQLPHPFPWGRRAEVRRDRREFDAIIDDEIARLRADPEDDGLNILETLVADGQLSDGEIRDQIDTLIGAGYDTTAATLAWLLIRVARTPGLWTRLRAEADAVLGDVVAGEIGHEQLAALRLADATVHESLRLHPAGVIGVREAAADVVAGGYRIPKGTMITWSPHLVGRDPSIWPDHLTFDADRHLDPTDEQAAANKTGWIPFGGGARNCIGFALAQIELTLILARLAQRGDIATDDDTIPAAVGMVVNRPVGGAPLRVSTRS